MTKQNLTALAVVFLAGAAAAHADTCTTDLGIDLPADCAAVAVERIVEGAHNFREIAMPAAAAQKPRIKSDILFRSDALHALTDRDVEILQDKNIRTIVDLRSPEEVEEFPDRPIDAVEWQVNLPIGSDPNKTENLVDEETASRIRAMYFAGEFDAIDRLLAEANLDVEQIREERYRGFVTGFRPQMRRFMKLLTDEENFPLVFHCQGGKDRTGFAAAVVMRALGYDTDDALRDYLTTNLYDAELPKRVQQSPRSLLPIMGAHERQLLAAMDEIDRKFGSFENYLREGLELSDADVRAIRENLLLTPP